MKPLKLTNIDKTLLLAADYIERHGWCQNTAFTSEGVCLSYAILDSGGPAPLEAHSKMERRLGMSIPRWNDVPGRTREEVLSILRMVSPRP